MDRLKHWWRLMRAGLPRLWATIAACVAIAGGSVVLGVHWGFKHAVWGLVVALALMLAVIIEGSYREFRSLEKRHQAELAALRAPSLPLVSAEPEGWTTFCEVTGSGMLMFKLHSTLATPSPVLRVQALGNLKCRVHDPNGAYSESQAIRRDDGWATVEYSDLNFVDMLGPAAAGRYEFAFYEQQSDAAGSWLLLKSGGYDAAAAPEVYEELAPALRVKAPETPSPVADPSASSILLARKLEMRVDERRRLEECLSEGNVLQARITGCDLYALLPVAIREEVAAWEAKTTALLARKRGWLVDFDLPAPSDPFAVTASTAHKRISGQLRVLQAAIR